jgi:lipopolysaccharide transport system ATP-binding protein
MPEIAISVENLSKRYLIGHRFFRSRYDDSAFRYAVGREIRNFARKATDVIRGRQVVQGDEIEAFWALRDVSFEVKQGEILGIVGRNGAGKSTLLKILSRITEPTKGRVTLRGRAGSLLDVGTGFHPELTGRENVFLNGAVLGMSQREVGKRFDEIVAFAEVEKFIDTPLKYYSSGMYVRLAFAVAAHLEPEILIIDEVLAVGDFAFQNKCLGKIDEISRSEGRTVLFVSHNVEVVQKLCTSAIFIEAGTVQAMGDAQTAVSAYVQNQSSSPREVDLSNKTRPDRVNGNARLVSGIPSDAGNSWSIPFGHRFSLDLSIETKPSVTEVEVLIGIFSTTGFEVASWTTKCSNTRLVVSPGTHTLRIEFPDLRLLPGHYFLGINLRSSRGLEDAIREAVQFEITTSAEAAEIDAYRLRGGLLLNGTVAFLDQSAGSS